VLSGGILAASTLAGRLTSHVPARLLIGPGLIIIGVGLLLMRGLDAASAWTHLIPGMIVAGAGAGMVNPPLAATAVGVVPPQRAGMASGISSTFRQVGIATGIALLGTLFSSKVHDEVLARVAAVPGLSRQGPQIATAVQSGEIGHVIGQLPAPARQAVGVITRTAFTAGLDRILLVAAIIAFVAGLVSLAAIRSRDFARAAPGGQEGPEMKRPGRAGTQAGSGRVAATTTVAAARAADRPGLPDDKAALSGLAGSVGAALVHRFHGSVLVVRGGNPAWNAASASGPPSGRRHLSPLTPQIGEHHVVVRSDLPRTAPS